MGAKSKQTAVSKSLDVGNWGWQLRVRISDTVGPFWSYNLHHCLRLELKKVVHHIMTTQYWDLSKNMNIITTQSVCRFLKKELESQLSFCLKGYLRLQVVMTSVDSLLNYHERTNDLQWIIQWAHFVTYCRWLKLSTSAMAGKHESHWLIDNKSK